MRLRPILVPTLTLLLGAQAPDPAAALKAAYTKRVLMVPMRDGVKLCTVVYEPKDTSRSYPILLNRTPYGAGPYAENEFRESLGPNPLFAKEGFIFVYQDVRGTFMSEGSFVDMRPEDHAATGGVDESTDAWDSIDWLVKHLPRNNGRVGQYGISYPGFYTACALVDSHPALKAASPQAPVTDWFAVDDFHRNGTFWLPHAFNFFSFFGQPRPAPTAEKAKPFEHGTPDGYDFFLRMGALPQADAKYLHGRVAFWEELMRHGSRDAFWEARDLRPHLKGVKPAVLTVGGWFDAENLFGALQVHKAIAATTPGADDRLVMGPWSHGGWERTEGDHLGHATFGARTSGLYQRDIELPFFLHYLKDAPIKPLAPVYAFNTGANQWRQLEAWPPKGLEPKRLYFRAGGRLSFDPPGAEGEDRFLSDPAHPVPYTEAVVTAMSRDYMTDDQRFAGRRPDVLSYQSEPLEADTTLAGPLAAELFVATTGTDADWVVKLIDVFPDDAPDELGYDANLNWHRGGYQMLVRGEPIRGKFRNSLSAPEPFVPGKPTRVAFQLDDLFHTFRKGHRIMVQVQSSWFPLMDRNPQVFEDIYAARDADFKAQTHTVFHDAERPSGLGVGIWHPDFPGRGHDREVEERLGSRFRKEHPGAPPISNWVRMDEPANGGPEVWILKTSEGQYWYTVKPRLEEDGTPTWDIQEENAPKE